MTSETFDLGSLRIVYLPANQAYALMWMDHHILRIFNTRQECVDEARYILNVR